VKQQILDWPFPLVTLLVTLLALGSLIVQAQPAREAFPPPLRPEEFADLSRSLSEPGGYFDTDNLISNEASYLHVLGPLREQRVEGGAFLGVGPDQGFSYIAQIQPTIAFMIDVRRDNLLQHLLFKGLFAAAPNRLAYLCLLFGKPLPEGLATWSDRPIVELIAYLNGTPATEKAFEAASRAIRPAILRSGIDLSETDWATIRRLHQAFFEGGLQLRFTSHQRAPRDYYPTYQDLLLETDRTGHQGNYLAREASFQILKSLQERNRIIPVVGNLAGPHSLRAIGEYLRRERIVISAFYTSNVEYYLMRGRRGGSAAGEDPFRQFVENVASLPRNRQSVLIRSYFHGSWGGEIDQSVSGYFSTQLAQPLDRFVREAEAGSYRSYGSLIGSGHHLAPR
jgi:hypothetical protein